MRILYIAYLFPPYMSSGTVRTGKTVRFLTELGHDVRVLSAADQPLQPTMPLEIDEHRVTRTTWLDVNRPAEIALGGRKRVAAVGYAPPSGAFGRFLKRAGRCYKSLVHWPDGQIGWLPFAVHAGNRAVRDWRPDLIFASALPATTLLVGRGVARRWGIPWVAELRDLWVDPWNESLPRWRQRWDTRWERRVLSSAAALVTVSTPLAEVLLSRHKKPTAVVPNGYDAGDYPAIARREDGPDAPLRIVYTGMIYEGRQDPSPLFEAMQLMGDRAKKLRVVCYGRYLDGLRQSAQQHGVGELVEVNRAVPYYEALRHQREADLLLFLSWTDERQQGVYTGKLFEYLGARRPILGIGPTSNVAAALIRERSAGFVSADPRAIAKRLETWIATKECDGSIVDLPGESCHGLSRDEQLRSLERFLVRVVERDPTLQPGIIDYSAAIRGPHLRRAA
jgi:glycosyltransferase involved in cell wall biosynthesis